jgi:L-ribulose-5-phosphate 4-epimerase
MRPDEIRDEYEVNTAKIIVERFVDIDPQRVAAVLVADHGPFTWGASPTEAAQNAAILEHVAMLAAQTVRIEPYPKPISQDLLDKHYSRKQGPGAYYGQK